MCHRGGSRLRVDPTGAEVACPTPGRQLCIISGVFGSWMSKPEIDAEGLYTGRVRFTSFSSDSDLWEYVSWLVVIDVAWKAR